MSFLLHIHRFGNFLLLFPNYLRGTWTLDFPIATTVTIAFHYISFEVFFPANSPRGLSDYIGRSITLITLAFDCLMSITNFHCFVWHKQLWEKFFQRLRAFNEELYGSDCISSSRVKTKVSVAVAALIVFSIPGIINISHVRNWQMVKFFIIELHSNIKLIVLSIFIVEFCLDISRKHEYLREMVNKCKTANRAFVENTLFQINKCYRLSHDVISIFNQILSRFFILIYFRVLLHILGTISIFLGAYDHDIYVSHLIRMLVQFLSVVSMFLIIIIE